MSADKYEHERAALEARGYRDIPAAPNGVKVGDRVHNRGEQYYAARQHGTAVVLAVMEKNPSSWAQTYGHPDIEIIIRRDKPLFADWSPISVWADYGTELPVGGDQ